MTNTALNIKLLLINWLLLVVIVIHHIKLITKAYKFLLYANFYLL